MQDLTAASSHSATWTEEQIRAAWNQGQLADRLNPEKWRKDACGAWIAWQQFGNKESSYGWEIVAAGDSVPQPLQWKNASAKHDGRSACAVVAYGGENISVR